MTDKTPPANNSQFILHNSYFIILFSLAILVIPAASPYFGDGVPRTNDLFPHLYRTFALGRALIWDPTWPRWSPELVHGYGYPVFNFFPSLSHLLIYTVHKLGFTLTNAYRIVVFLHLYTAALTSYALGRELTHSKLSGYLAAAAYIYSPYLLYDFHIRGSAPETQALALLPLLILGLHKLSHKPTPSSIHTSYFILHTFPWLPLTALTFATIFLSHHGILFQLCFPIGLWLLLVASSQPPVNPESKIQNLKSKILPLLPPLLALALGGLLVAFFALPALLEISATQADASISQGYTYQTNFLTLSQLFDWPDFPADPALVNPPVVRPLPLVALTVAYLLILIRWRQFTPATKRTITIWTIILIVSTFLITPASQFLWDNIRLLQLTFYPWRLLGMTSLTAAILTALATQPHIQHPTSSISFILHNSYFIIPLLLLSTLPWLFPPQEPITADITQATVSRFEILPLFIGTTTLGEFLPAWVDEFPDTAAQQAALTAGENPDRLQRPQGVTAVWQNNNPIDAHYTININQPTTLTYNQFYFPGWKAAVDGQAVPITPSQPHGLLTFDVPAGQHELSITFGTTPTRRLGTIISLITLLILIALLYGHPLWVPAPSSGTPSPTASSHPQGMLLLASLTLLLLWLFFTFIPTPLRRSTLLPDGILGKPQITPLDYAGELRLLTFEQSAAQITADEPVELTLYWQPQHGIGVEYLVGVQIVDENGIVWNTPDTTRPADWRFVAGDEPWPLDGYRIDPFVLNLLDGAPPQTYRFVVGLVQKNTNQTVAAHTIGELVVTQPANGSRPLEEGMQPQNITTAGLALLGSRVDRNEARPGDPMRVATLWQAIDPASAPNQFTLQLTSESGERLLERPQPITTIPTNRWRVADRFRSAPTFRLPADLPSGTHQWQAVWGDQTIPLDTLTITAPERTFTPPTPDIPLNTQLGDLTTLIGANTPLTIDNRQLTIDNSPLPVTLYWQPITTPTTSYRVFVHLRNDSGQIVAQSDGEPAQWTRPTTGWLPSEIISDEHHLPLPPDLPTGSYSLVTGLYDPATGQRLVTPNDEDSITIITIQHEP